jgi:hypothetical protein
MRASLKASYNRATGTGNVLLLPASNRPSRRWLPDVDLTIRTATREKSMRITWPDRTTVVVGFTSRGAGKSQVSLAHEKLLDRAAVSRMKEYWSERLRALEEVLTVP